MVLIFDYLTVYNNLNICLTVVMHIKEIKWLNTFNPDVSDCSCNYLHNYAMTNVAVCTFARPMYNLNRFKNNNNNI